MTYEEHEQFEYVRARIRQEGFHYCFNSYSSFSEIEDLKFHALRLSYLEAARNLENYVEAKCEEEIDEEEIDNEENL
jgi:hypothetical protein